MAMAYILFKHAENYVPTRVIHVQIFGDRHERHSARRLGRTYYELIIELRWLVLMRMMKRGITLQILPQRPSTPEWCYVELI